MKSVKELEQEYEEMLQDDTVHDFAVMNKEYQLQRARLSEEFKLGVLPIFRHLVQECIEKADESFFITFNSGRKFIYYCTKARLVPIDEKGRKRQSFYLPPHGFIEYFKHIGLL